MTTDLKTLIERKLDAQKLVSINGANQDYFDEQFEQIKNEVLPILLECVEALEKVSLKKTMTVYSHSEEFMDGANTAFCQAAEISDEALDRLRKWSESK